MKYKDVLRQLLLVLLFFVSSFSLSYASVLTDFSGKPHSLEEYTGKGKWRIVMIWASDCPICNREARSYSDFHFKHEESDAEVLGISVDGSAKKAAAEHFIERHELNFPNLIGEPRQVALLFRQLTGANWLGTPTFLVFNPKGELKAQQAGAVPPGVIEEFIQANSPKSTTKDNSAK